MSKSGYPQTVQSFTFSRNSTHILAYARLNFHSLGTSYICPKALFPVAQHSKLLDIQRCPLLEHSYLYIFLSHSLLIVKVSAERLPFKETFFYHLPTIPNLSQNSITIFCRSFTLLYCAHLNLQLCNCFSYIIHCQSHEGRTMTVFTTVANTNPRREQIINKYLLTQ